MDIASLRIAGANEALLLNFTILANPKQSITTCSKHSCVSPVHLEARCAKNHRLHQTYWAIYYFIETRLGSPLGFWSLGTINGTWTSKKNDAEMIGWFATT